jgi:superfamily II DNA or RNA helicase
VSAIVTDFFIPKGIASHILSCAKSELLLMVKHNMFAQPIIKVVNSLNRQNAIRYFDHPLIKKRSVEFRSYQFNIFESLRNSRNTLVILPTALGKTVIAILVCAEPQYNYKSKRVLVMAPTKPLVSQHMSSFFSVLNIPENCVAVVTGKNLPQTRLAVWNRK